MGVVGGLDWDWDCGTPMVCRGTPAEVSMLWLTSNNSLPSRRLSVPSDHRIMRLLDSRRCENMLRGVFGDGILNIRLDQKSLWSNASELYSQL